MFSLLIVVWIIGCTQSVTPSGNFEYSSSSTIFEYSSSSTIFEYSSSSTIFEYSSSSAIFEYSSSSAIFEYSSSSTNILESISELGRYTAKDSVAAYIYLYQKLPANYVNKETAKVMYEVKSGQSFSKWNFNPWLFLEVMVGGDSFYNTSEILPEIDDFYYECDVDYYAENRGTKRLVYNLNGTVYYSADHYESFSLLYVK